VGPRDVLDAVVKRTIPSPCQVSNPRTPIVHPIAQHYTDRAIMAMKNNYLYISSFVFRGSEHHD
jgi:hypothetical protein